MQKPSALNAEAKRCAITSQAAGFTKADLERPRKEESRAWGHDMQWPWMVDHLWTTNQRLKVL